MSCSAKVYDLVTGKRKCIIIDYNRLVHLYVEDCFEELPRQQSYAIKNQLGHPKPPSKGFGAQNTSIGEYLNTQLLLGGLQPGLHSVYCGLSRVPTWGLISVHPGLRLVPPTNTLEDKLVEIQFQRGRGEVKLREGVAYCLQRKVVVVGGWYGGDYREP